MNLLSSPTTLLSGGGIYVKWLFVIDPIESLKYATDSSFAIMKEASRRGIRVFHCTVQQLSHSDGETRCAARFFPFPDTDYGVQNSAGFRLDDFDMIFMRKDPPYDDSYHYATQILSLATKPVVNSPRALRDFNEKLAILGFPDLIPETVVTSSRDDILAFLGRHEEGIVLKSLDSYQGRSVTRIEKREPIEAIDRKMGEFSAGFTLPVMIQQFLPAVQEGDKRILVLGGRCIGAVSRVPKKGSFLSNFAQGGTGKKTMITKRDAEIVDRISGFLVENGLHFVGIDVIGDCLTEINITCPTGIVQVNALDGVVLEKQVVDYFMEIASHGKRVQG